MKKTILALFLVCLTSWIYGQNTTNNNTVIIHGNVYYFQPSSSQSSPLPRVGSNNFIGTGSWYGENAARAWASVSDWAVERCLGSDSPVRGNSNERVYISQVHAYRIWGDPFNQFGERRRTQESITHGTSIINRQGANNAITIYYWIVRNGDLMENGKREKRTFIF